MCRKFPRKNKGKCLVFLSKEDGILDSQRSAALLSPFYEIVWDDVETHKFKKFPTIYNVLKPLNKVKRKKDDRKCRLCVYDTSFSRLSNG